MNSLMDFLGQLEKLAYSLAVWIILIPKTIFKIFTNPGWVRRYVAKEFSEAKESRFDDYISPVILLLLCSLVPFVGFQLLPNFGVMISNDGESILGSNTCIQDNSCAYQIAGNFLGDSSTYSVEWQCREEAYYEVDPTVGKKLEVSGYKLASEAACTWTTPGMKQVYAAVVNSYGGIVDENYLDVEVKSSAAGGSSTQPAETVANQIRDRGEQNLNGAKNLVDGVKNNSYLGILFLLPALAFSLAARGLKVDKHDDKQEEDKKDEKGVSAETLKEVFYAQCYYFTPVSLATYLVLYGFHFSTSGDWFANILLMLAFAAVCVWFFIVEVNAVFQERKFEKKRSAYAVVVGTLILILVVSFFALILIGDPEMLRSWSYTLVKWGIIFVALYYLVLRRVGAWWKNRKNKKDSQPT